MNRQTKLTSQQKEQEQSLDSTQQTERAAGLEFSTPEAMLRHDALHTPVPPTVAFRLRDSIGKTGRQPLSWWRRLMGRSDG